MRRYLVVFAVVVHLVLADAVAKELAAGYLKGASSLPVIPGFFDLAYVENRGCAWGMFQGQVWPLAAFAVVALAFLLWKRKSIFGDGRAAAVAEVFLYAGIVGNLIDRVFRGFVIDFTTSTGRPRTTSPALTSPTHLSRSRRGFLSYARS